MSDLTSYGYRIVAAVVKRSQGVGMRTLAVQLHMDGDYATYDQAIKDLVKYGYLTKNSQTSNLKATAKGKKAVGK